MYKETVIPEYSKRYFPIDNGVAGIYKGQRLDLCKLEVFGLYNLLIAYK